MCLGYNNQNDYWRIQCQMTMGEAPVPQNINTRKRRKKRRGKRRKKKKRKHKSSKSNESSDSEWREPGLFNILFSQTRHCGQRWEDHKGRRDWRGTGEMPGGRGCGVPGEGLTCLPGRMPVVRCQVLALTSGWRAFPLVLLPADSVGPNSLEMPQAGRPDEGSLCCCRFHLQGGATCVELRPDFPLLLRIIKAHYLF